MNARLSLGLHPCLHPVPSKGIAGRQWVAAHSNELEYASWGDPRELRRVIALEQGTAGRT
jgi:hypothetical protein